ncbi:TonB-dependent receptor [Parvularcula sp. ZS-1/3]|uniref:TonB-dependent receptor n=1 Tax=Parvularcula mediterranea TaxID=2732508 RepID=A0A7Y3RKW2_9PROT|nr:TonB-dependent receptor [Parvularcula mediterranea]NNU15959.1 TonB-dependent receptor [Parvularcula mediterranea]
MRRLTISLAALAAGLAGTALASSTVYEVPAREAVQTLADEAGLVVIYDPRRLDRAGMVAIDPARNPRRALQDVVQSLGMELERVGRGTFAIRTEGPKKPVVVASLDPSLQLVDTIVVTGAPIATRFAQEGAVTVVEGEELRLLNDTDISDAIFDLPQTLASFTSANTALFGATAGLNLADLRGLGPDRTQVLVNGRRRTPVSGGNGTVFAVDLTGIPTALLDRIEILDSNQSVAVGPDAAAGSINIVLRQAAEGLEVGARGSVSEEGDGELYSLYTVYGGQFRGERGSFVLGLEGTIADGLVGRDRALTSEPYGFAVDGLLSETGTGELLPGFGGSALTPEGRLRFAVLDDGSIVQASSLTNALIVSGDGRSLEPFVGSRDQLYNWSAGQSTLLPNERLLGYGKLDYELSDSAALFTELHLGANRTETRLSPVGAVSFSAGPDATGSGLVIDLESSLVPEAIRANFEGLGVSSIVLDKRLTALGPRISETDRLTLDAALGVDVQPTDSLSLSFQLRQGLTQTGFRQKNIADRRALEATLSPNLCAVTAGCVVARPFDADGFAGTENFIRAGTERTKYNVAETELLADAFQRIGTPIGRDIELRAQGSVRWDSVSTHTDRTAIDRLIGVFDGTRFEGHERLGQLALRAVIPLNGEESVLGPFNLHLGARAIHSEEADWTGAGEAGFSWNPRSWVDVRAMATAAGRPPNLSEVFARQPDEVSYARDPCAGLLPADQRTVAVNCRQTLPNGVDPAPVLGAGFLETPLLDLRGGEPEHTVSYRGDIIIKPHDLLGWENDRLQLRASYTDHLLRRGRRFATATGLCLASKGLEHPTCGVDPSGASYILREDETGRLLRDAYVLENDQRLQWRGFDFESRYVKSLDGRFGVERLWASGLHTWLLEARLDSALEEGQVNAPRHETLAAAGIQWDRQEIAVQLRRRGRVRTTTLDLPQSEIDAITTLDLAYRHEIGDRVRISASISNLTDDTPGIVGFTRGRNIYAEHYDIVGRSFGFGIEFGY